MIIRFTVGIRSAFVSQSLFVTKKSFAFLLYGLMASINLLVSKSLKVFLTGTLSGGEDLPLLIPGSTVFEPSSNSDRNLSNWDLYLFIRLSILVYSVKKWPRLPIFFLNANKVLISSVI